MVWQMWDLKQLFAYPGCDAGIRSMALSYDQRLEHSLVFTRISENIYLQLNYIFLFLLTLIFCRSQILVHILIILCIHKFLSNMSYLGQIIFLQDFSSWGNEEWFKKSYFGRLSRQVELLTCANIQCGRVEVEGYIRAFHVSSFTYDTNHIPNSSPLC